MANHYDTTAYDSFKHSISLPPVASTERLSSYDFGASYLVEAPSDPLLDYPQAKEDVANQKRSVRASQTSITSQSLRKRHLCANWTWEIAASALSYAAIVALVAILYTYNHTNKVKFGPTNLSLNSVVALLSTTIRVCCMFPVGAALLQGGYIHARRAARRAWSGQRLGDLEVFHKASRGALGSLKLFVSIKPQLATLGALLTVLALGFDFFSQQILGLHTEVLYDGQVAGIPSVLQLDTIHSLPWMGALYDGIFATSEQDMIVPCPTGNCVWPITPTIGVCSACQDITSLLNTTCDGTTGGCTYSTPMGSDDYCSSCGQDGNVTLFTPIPDIPVSMFIYMNGNTMGCGSGIIFQNRGNFTNTYNPIARFDSVNVQWRPGDDNPDALFNGSWVFSKPYAQECAMWLCVQSLQVLTHNGTQVETIIDTWGETELNTGDHKATFTKPPSTFTSNASFFDNFNISYDYGIPYNVFSGAFSGFERSADGTCNIFDGSVKLDNAETIQYQPSSQSMLAALQYLNSSTQDLTPWVRQIAKSLTNQLRSSSNNLPSLTNDYFAGTAYVSEAVFVIRWPWLTLPAFMVILSSLFLALSIEKTARARMPAWKGSPLNLIFAKVDTDLDKLVKGSLSRADAVMDKVGKSGMELYPDETGRWVFGMKKK